MSQIKERLRQIIVQALRLNRTPESIPDQNLTAELGLDSINSLELLIFVENEFKIQIDDADLSVSLVDSLDGLAAYIENKLGGETDHETSEAGAMKSVGNTIV
jgi:acyl carrier protein